MKGLLGMHELTLSELNADGTIRLMVPTLRLFNFEAVPHVHLRAATEATAAFLVKEVIGGVVHLLFLRAPETGNVLVLRHKDGRQRSFSELALPALDYALKKVWPLSEQLTSLGVSEYMATRDALALSDLSLPLLRIFSIFVHRATAPPTDLTHIFDLYDDIRTKWHFPALAELVFGTRAPICDVYSESWKFLTLSAAAVLQFYGDMIRRSVNGVGLSVVALELLSLLDHLLVAAVCHSLESQWWARVRNANTHANRAELRRVDPEDALREIEDVVGDTIADIRKRLRDFAVTPAVHSVTGSPVSSCKPSLRFPSTAPPAQYAPGYGVPQAKLPTEVLRHIFSQLSRNSDSETSDARGCFPDLIAAASVCRSWRSTALSSAKLWSAVHYPSAGELCGLDIILHRSANNALRVKLDLRDVPECVQSAVISCLIKHMHRIKLLVLRNNGVFVSEYGRLLCSPAPIIKELHLYSSEALQLHGDFLGGDSPKLAALTLAAQNSFPPVCAALTSLTTLHLLHNSVKLSVGEACYLLRICPCLRTLRLDFTLRDIPQGTVLPAKAFRGLHELTVFELATDTAVMAPILRLFDFGALTQVHLRSASMSTAGFLVKELLVGVEHLFFLRSGADNENALVLRHQDGRRQSFSELPVRTLEFLLKKAWPLSAQLVSLDVSEYMAPHDALALSALKLPSLRFFSIFVRGAPARPADLTHVVDIYGETRRQWRFPALAELMFDAHAPIRDVFRDVEASPALSATAILQFYNDMIRRSVEHRPRLVMNGVIFRDRFSGPEMDALRAAFYDVALHA
ncbi:hypothetical protein AURDEDRAFT_128603 [Auricularia subglabra TFB-10046 SS5]|nr:hypothetical protein AURDEDRAFT_128603 [Auricularia subglabra TFB-10046 SS5]